MTDQSTKQLSASEGRKYDSGKPMFGLVPPWALEEVAKVLTVGASKYAPDNWKYVEDGKRRYIDAAFRHLNSYVKGEINDPETGLNHMAHLICCAMFICDADVSGTPLAAKLVKVVKATQGDSSPPNKEQLDELLDTILGPQKNPIKPTNNLTRELPRSPFGDYTGHR